MSGPDLHTPHLGPAGQPCEECGAPLAADQRYCLNCGHRRAEPRLDFMAMLRGSALARPAPPPLAPTPVRDLPSPRLAAVLVLGLLGFGAILGAAATPPVEDSLAATARPPLTIILPPAATAPLPAARPPAPTPSVPPSSSNSAASSSPAPSTPAPTAPAPSPKAPAPTTTPKLPAIKHVFVIALADQGYAQAFGPQSAAPYLAHDLAVRGEVLTRYYAIGHGALANGIALLSGQGPNPDTEANCPTYTDFAGSSTVADDQAVGRGCVFPAQTATLPDQLTAAGLTWRAYVEDMGNVPPGAPGSCRHPDLGAPDPMQGPRPGDDYATWRNPFVYFHSIVDSPDCAANDVGLDHLAPDLAAGTGAPSFAYIVPDLCHDGRDAQCADGAPAGLPAANAFLRSVVPQILASKAYADGGLIVITFDQAPADGPHADSSVCCHPASYPNAPPAAGAKRTGGGRVGALLLSRFVKAGTRVSTPFDHFSLLKTLDQLFGLRELGYAARARVQPFGSGVWTRQIHAATSSSQDLHHSETPG